MDLQTRKLNFIQDFLRLKNISIVEKLEKMLYQEKKKDFSKDLKKITIEEFNSLIDSSEDDSKNNRLYNAGEILKNIDSWK